MRFLTGIRHYNYYNLPLLPLKNAAVTVTFHSTTVNQYSQSYWQSRAIFKENFVFLNWCP